MAAACFTPENLRGDVDFNLDVGAGAWLSPLSKPGTVSAAVGPACFAISTCKMELK